MRLREAWINIVAVEEWSLLLNGKKELTMSEEDWLDFDSKKAVLKVSPSLVGLSSRTGRKDLFRCSGIVVGCERTQDTPAPKFVATILTCASLLRFPSKSQVDHPSFSLHPEPDLTIVVYLSEGKLLEGHVSGFDFNYNIVIVKITSDDPLPTVILTDIHDFMPLMRNRSVLHHSKPFGLRPDGHIVAATQLCPGDKVVALARSHHQCCLLVRPGIFNVYGCGLDCQELYYTTCKTHDIFTGGPLINCDGEVIGIIFNYLGYATFLPSNIASRCLENIEQNRSATYPWFGMHLTNLYAVYASALEKIIQKFSRNCNGVMVEKVKKESPAEHAGIVPKDVIIKCGGEVVRFSLEFFQMMWDRAGQPVEVVVLRPSIGKPLTLTMVADEITPSRYNSWPIPTKVEYGV